jgi:hypothetical protein
MRRFAFRAIHQGNAPGGRSRPGRTLITPYSRAGTFKKWGNLFFSLSSNMAWSATR